MVTMVKHTCMSWRVRMDPGWDPTKRLVSFFWFDCDQVVGCVSTECYLRYMHTLHTASRELLSFGVAT